MSDFKQRKFRIYANDGETTVYATVEIYGHRLSTLEAKKMRSELKRRLTEALLSLPYFSPQFEDISIKNMKTS